MKRKNNKFFLVGLLTTFLLCSCSLLDSYLYDESSSNEISSSDISSSFDDSSSSSANSSSSKEDSSTSTSTSSSSVNSSSTGKTSSSNKTSSSSSTTSSSSSKNSSSSTSTNSSSGKTSSSSSSSSSPSTSTDKSSSSSSSSQITADLIISNITFNSDNGTNGISVWTDKYVNNTIAPYSENVSGKATYRREAKTANNWRWYFNINANGYVSYAAFSKKEGYASPSDNFYYRTGEWNPSWTEQQKKTSSFDSFVLADDWMQWASSEPASKNSSHWDLVIPQGGFTITGRGENQDFVDFFNTIMGDNSITKEKLIAEQNKDTGLDDLLEGIAKSKFDDYYICLNENKELQVSKRTPNQSDADTPAYRFTNGGAPTDSFKHLPEVRFSSTFEYASKDRIGYKMRVPYTDTYKVEFISSNIKKYTILSENDVEICSSDMTFTTPALQKDSIIYVVINVNSNNIIETKVTATNHVSVLPYDSNFSVDPSTIDVNTPITQYQNATVNYVKRNDGTYINSNNPERLIDKDLNNPIFKKSLSGEVFFTFEHNNAPSVSFYYGFQLKNKTSNNLYITIKNIGFQLDGPGSWLGQNEWIQFYNTYFEYDTEGWDTAKWDYFNKNYSFVQTYRPENNQPQTVVLPPGEQIYVMGGTTSDSYKGFNAYNTADKTVYKGCSNAAVLFDVSGGEALGTFFAYTSPSLISEEKDVIGYVYGKGRAGDGTDIDHEYGQQYGGYDTCNGVVDNEMTFKFGDVVQSGYLAVNYKNYYSKTAPSKGTPYAAIGSMPYDNSLNSWVTHLNPQSGDHRAVGTDMTRYITIDSVTRKEIIIDTDHYDGLGLFANIGNWMIDYQDRFTLVNTGSKERTITFTLKGDTISLMVRDVDGNILEAKQILGRIENIDFHGEQFSYLYSVKVPAHSVKQLTLEYNLLANSYGSISHRVYLD